MCLPSTDLSLETMERVNGLDSVLPAAATAAAVRAVATVNFMLIEVVGSGGISELRKSVVVVLNGLIE